jgi:hypothetical protein
MVGQSLRGWMRDLHLYVGIAASPLVIVYALSTLVLNHPNWPWGAPRPVADRSVAVTLGDTSHASSLRLGREVLRQAGVSGEIMFVRREPAKNRLEIPVQRPGDKITIEVDLAGGRAIVKHERTSFWSRLVFLHKMPGPHVVDLRGNWLPVALWRWFADATALGVLFLTATGVYLWAALRAERRTGLLCLVAGLGVFGLLVAGIVL